MSDETPEGEAITVRSAEAILGAVERRETWAETEDGPIHVNYGQSEDMMRGYGHGCDGVPSDPPAEEPWRSAYLEGYADGQRMAPETPEALTATLSLADWRHVKDYLLTNWWQSERSDRIEAVILDAIERGEAMAAGWEE